MAFTIRANQGDERSAFVFAAGGTPTGSIDVIIDDSAFPQKDEAARLLRAMADRLDESSTDWPPA